MKSIIFAFAAIAIIKIIYAIIKRISSKKHSSFSAPSRDWYGTCEKCGKTDGLHRFEGKKYCAWCYAKLKTEKKYGVTKNQDEN